MITLLDSNILIHAANAASHAHDTAKRLRDQAVEGILPSCLTPQILWEFYAVITNARRVDQPLTQESALREVQAYVQATQIALLLPRRSAVERTLSFLARHRVRGLRIFDLFLIATMLDHGVRRIYTENVEDFQGFREIEAINPFTSQVAA